MTAKLYHPLEGRVIVVTGAAGLLGPRHADSIISAGGTPVLLDIRADALQTVVEELEARFGQSVMSFPCDVTAETSVVAVRDVVVASLGRIDGLVNNAARNPKVESGSATSFTRLRDFTTEQWNADIAVGLTGAFYCAKHFGEVMAGQGCGSIVNISSEYGRLAPDQRLYELPMAAPDRQPVKPISYTVVKAGLHGMTLYLSTYWATAGVRSNTLVLGGVENGQSSEFLERAASRVPLGRMARPTEFGGALVYLLSDASSFVTGTELVVDGGKSAW